MMDPATPMCSATDQARLRPQRSCSKNISALASMTLQRLRHNTHIHDSRLLHRIHHLSEGAEGYVFVGADENGLVLRIADLLPQPGGNLIDVDGIVPQKYALLLVHADHQPLFSDFFEGA